jgi:DNA-binding transcriptional LysR family regulator
MADEFRIEGFRYAIEVAETGSFSAAARNVGITQPALSNGISRLERRLGRPLFERSTRGVVTTSFGAAMLPAIDRAVAGIDAVAAEAARWDAPTSADIRLGVSPLINPQLVSRAQRIVAEVAADSDRSRLSGRMVLREANLADLRDALLGDELDLLLIPSVDPLPRFQHRIVDSEPLVLVDRLETDGTVEGSPADNGSVSPLPPSNTSAADLDELADRDLILLPDTCGLTKFTVDLLRTRNLPLRSYAGEASSYRVLEEWSKIGLGSALMPESKVNGADTARRHVIDEEGHLLEIFYEAVWNPHSMFDDDLRSVSDRLGTTA